MKRDFCLTRTSVGAFSFLYRSSLSLAFHRAYLRLRFSLFDFDLLAALLGILNNLQPY
jgi:hypothetical protein